MKTFARSCDISSIRKSQSRSFVTPHSHSLQQASLKGRKTAAYPALEPDVQAAGAEFVNSEAVVDGVMVSARAWPDHPAFMREFIKILRQAAPISRDAAVGR